MANKINLISLVNAQLTALITQAKVRLSASLMLNEFYPDIINDTHLSSTVLIKNNSLNLQYNVSIVKSGRMIFLKGFIKNNTGSVVTDSSSANFFFRIENQDFVADVSSSFNNKTLVSSTQNVGFQTEAGVDPSENNTLFFINTIAAGETVYFNTYYFTKN